MLSRRAETPRRGPSKVLKNTASTALFFGTLQHLNVAQSGQSPRPGSELSEVQILPFRPEFGEIAQTGERLSCKQGVAGSIPAFSTSTRKLKPIGDGTRPEPGRA